MKRLNSVERHITIRNTSLIPIFIFQDTLVMAKLMNVNFSKYWQVIKAYGPVSTLPIFVCTCIYLDWSKTQKYKARKAIEDLPRSKLQREFDKKINL